MNERLLGSRGPTVSLVGLGCNNIGGRLDEARSREVVAASLDAGITLFDTADIYPLGAPGVGESLLGKLLGADRDRVLIATKSGEGFNADFPAGASRTQLLKAVDESLARLGTDWIDIYQIHMRDPDTPLRETVSALADLVDAGKIRYFGVSNHSAADVAAIGVICQELGCDAFVACQDEYSLADRKVEQELIPTMIDGGLGLLPYFPLAGGLLTGKYLAPAPEGGVRGRLDYSEKLRDRLLNEPRLEAAQRLSAVAEQTGRTMLELALGWLAAQQVVSSIIAGASSRDQVLSNVSAAQTVLRDEELKLISPENQVGAARPS
jgi:aryl-alcohol dehydrogenase-like predicted oxidoreductase